MCSPVESENCLGRNVDMAELGLADRWYGCICSDRDIRNTRANASSIAPLNFAFQLLFNKLIDWKSLMFCGSLSIWTALIKPNVRSYLYQSYWLKSAVKRISPNCNHTEKTQPLEFKLIINKYCRFSSECNERLWSPNRLFGYNKFHFCFISFHFLSDDITHQVNSRTYQQFNWMNNNN